MPLLSIPQVDSVVGREAVAMDSEDCDSLTLLLPPGGVHHLGVLLQELDTGGRLEKGGLGAIDGEGGVL